MRTEKRERTLFSPESYKQERVWETFGAQGSSWLSGVQDHVEAKEKLDVEELEGKMNRFQWDVSARLKYLWEKQSQDFGGQLYNKFFAPRSVIAWISITHLTSPLLDVILERCTKEIAKFPDLKQTEK